MSIPGPALELKRRAHTMLHGVVEAAWSVKDGRTNHFLGLEGNDYEFVLRLMSRAPRPTVAVAGEALLEVLSQI